MNAIPGSAVALRDALRTGEISAREATEHFLGEIEHRGDLGSFVSVTFDAAIREATAADARSTRAHRTDEPLPPLHGLPTAHKDLVEVAGSVATHGSAAVPHTVATADAPGVAVLRRAGAISLGKTQVPEFGLTGYSENLIADPARNPHDASRTAGGSSGGSAAAVAASLLPVAPGSDGGGSIRIPALACGLVGLKPGLGTVPTDLSHGTHDGFGTPRLTVSGPLARDTADAAMLFDAMRGIPGEPSLTAVRAADGLSRLRIAVSTASPFAAAYPVHFSPEALAAVEMATARLERHHHRVEEGDFRYDPGYADSFTTAWTAGLSLMKLSPEEADRLTPLTRTFRERALGRSDTTHRAAAARLRDFAADARSQWGQFDAVLTPGLAFAPPRIGAFTSLSPDDDYRLQCEWAPLTSMVNVAGVPAIAVPLGPEYWSGVQLIGRPGNETQLLQLATQLMQG